MAKHYRTRHEANPNIVQEIKRRLEEHNGVVLALARDLAQIAPDTWGVRRINSALHHAIKGYSMSPERQKGLARLLGIEIPDLVEVRRPGPRKDDQRATIELRGLKGKELVKKLREEKGTKTWTEYFECLTQ